MKNKSKILIGIVCALILIVYNVIFFAVPFNRELSQTSFWITYFVTTFLILSNGFVFFYSFKNDKINKNIFSIPVFKVTFSSFIIQILFDIIVMSVGNFFTFAFWITLIVEVLLLAISIILIVIRFSYKEKIIDVDNKTAIKTSFIQEVKIQMELIDNISKDTIYSGLISKLYEKIKYCDPISESESKDIENEILSKIGDLKDLVSDNTQNKESVNKVIKKISLLIDERGLRIKNSH